jgi:ATP-dependent helicase/nuclease subunit A
MIKEKTQMPDWTKDQSQAINSSNKNLLVSAAAGSGKTAVLIQRIIRIVIEEKVSVDRLLVVTFTKLAAEEMKTRLKKALKKELRQSEADKAYIQEQLYKVSSSDINTFHSFCKKLISQYFQELSLDPNFRMIDDIEGKLLRQEIVEKVLENEYEAYFRERDKGFEILVEMYTSNKDDVALKQIILSYYSFLMNQPDHEKWMQDAIDKFDISEENYKTHPWIINYVAMLEVEFCRNTNRLKEIRAISEQTEGFEKVTLLITEEINKLELLQKSLLSDYMAFSTSYKNLRFENYGKVRSCKKVDEDIYQYIKDVRDEVKENIQKLEIVGNLQQQFQQLSYLKIPMDALNRLFIDFNSLYTEEKRKEGVLDFNDLEQYALALLSDKIIAADLKKRYNYIFIDEYQDTNRVQEKIINCFKKKDNLFMVGDVKQSIYSFRQAEPEIFIEKYKTFSETDTVNERIMLSQNFRSNDIILGGINEIFSKLMSEKIGGIAYDRKVSLYPGLQQYHLKAESEIHILDTSYDEDKYPDIEIENIEKIEARLIGERIFQLLGTDVYDAKTEKIKKIDYKDIVILLRTKKNKAEIYLNQLTEMGIPCYFGGGESYFESLEISTVMNILKIIDNPVQDVPLLSVMSSPIFEFSPDDLAIIRGDNRGNSFYSCIKKYIENGENKNNPAIIEKLEKFRSNIQNWQNDIKYKSIDIFIWDLLLETGYYHYSRAFPDGLQRQANLDIFVSRARQYMETNYKGIGNFIKYVENIQSNSNDLAQAKILSSEDNVVRIMTIHASKGLEFPVVILARAGGSFRANKLEKKVNFHKGLGICAEYSDPDKRVVAKERNIAQNSYLVVDRYSYISEEMRILYVALTRAKERLIIFGSIKDETKFVNTIKKFEIKNTVFQQLSYLHWIIGAITEQDKFRTNSISDLRYDNKRWKISKHILTDFINDNQLEVVNTKEKEYGKNNLNSVSKEVKKRLEWEYPYTHALVMPNKLSVTQITKNKPINIYIKKGENADSRLKPNFISRNKKYDGMAVGTATHSIMQYLDINKVRKCFDNEEKLADYIRRLKIEMVKKEILEEEVSEIVNDRNIIKFCLSDIGQRMFNSQRIKQEMPFNYNYQSDTIRKEWENTNETLMVQGIIDCCFIEDGKWVVIDYKTDIDKNIEKSELFSGYQNQIRFYKEALEELSGIMVKEAGLYFLSLNKYIKI